MRIECPICRGPHPKWECKKPAQEFSWAVSASVAEVVKVGVRSRPSPTGTKSAAALKETQRNTESSAGRSDPLAGTQALPVDTNSLRTHNARSGNAYGGKPLTQTRPAKFNKNEYQCRYMREVYRPRLKAKKEAAT